jgi:hypothetical protein
MRALARPVFHNRGREYAVASPTALSLVISIRNISQKIPGLALEFPAERLER